MKVGDKVKCIRESSAGALKKGQEYTIKIIDEGYCSIDSACTVATWNLDRFEAVPEVTTQKTRGVSLIIPKDDQGIYEVVETEDHIVVSRWKHDQCWNSESAKEPIVTLEKGDWGMVMEPGISVFDLRILFLYLEKHTWFGSNYYIVELKDD